MLQPIEKPSRRPLVHHPSAALDEFGRYDATNERWCRFDRSVSQQLIDFEAANERYIRLRSQSRRRSMGF